MPPSRKPFRAPTDAELELLKALWDDGPAAPAELRERLAARGMRRAYTTVQTLLKRLVAKDLVRRAERDGASVYRAALDQEEVLSAQMGDLARRVCDGRTSPLMKSLLRSPGLSTEELGRLRELLEEAQREQGARDAKEEPT